MSTSDEPPVVTLVVFIGGVTYSEVSALRFLSNQEDCKCLIFEEFFTWKPGERVTEMCTDVMYCNVCYCFSLASTVFYVLTTQMVNGSTVIESLRETMKPSIL